MKRLKAARAWISKVCIVYKFLTAYAEEFGYNVHVNDSICQRKIDKNKLLQNISNAPYTHIDSSVHHCFKLCLNVNAYDEHQQPDTSRKTSQILGNIGYKLPILY